MTKYDQASEMVDNFYQEHKSGHPMFTNEDIKLLKWMLKQIKETRRENVRLNRAIGKHSGDLNEAANELLNLSNKLFRV